MIFTSLINYGKIQDTNSVVHYKKIRYKNTQKPLNNGVSTAF